LRIGRAITAAAAQSVSCEPWRQKIINLVKRFAKDVSGATAVEYGLVAAGISVAIVAVVQGLGSKLISTFVQDAFM
jgi:pilus assembly protein Flp/PilA